MFRIFFITLLLCIGSVTLPAVSGADALDPAAFRHLPVAFQGRFLPMEAYARLWLYEFYHREAVANKDRDAFQGEDRSALLLC